MASSIINIHALGAIKQGDVIFAFKFSETSTWTLALCEINSQKVLFAKHSSGSSFEPMALSKLENSGWLTDSGIAEYAKALKPFALTETQSAGMAYTVADKEIGLYTDGKGAISTNPFTQKDATDVIKEVLGGSSVSASTEGSPQPATPFYKKPLNYVLAGLAALAAYFAWKSFSNEDED
ncbi:MAG: hypothetical protein ACOVOQ_17655 [Flavobacterium sp.]